MSLKISEYTTEQTTIEDTDRQELSTEIAPSVWETRWYSITNLKAKLKAYFDTLYLTAVPTLNEVLVEGNETLGTNIKVNDADAIELENTSQLKKGTYDFGADGGISRICGVGYEDMWQAGTRFVFDNMGYVREATNCFNIVPDGSFDDTQRFKVGSRWILDDGTLYVCTDATATAAVWDLIPSVPNLQQVTAAGNTTTSGIDVAAVNVTQGTESFQINSSGQIDVIPDTTAPSTKTTIQFTTPTANNNITLQDASGTLAFLSDITGGGGILHGTASGTDTYTVTITGPTAYNDGDAYLVRFTNGNTTGATLNINSIGAIDLYRNNDGALIGGDIVDGGEMLCVYNSTTNRFQVIGTAPNTLLAYVTNDDSIPLTKGMPVYAFSGTGDRMTVKRADNSSDATSAQTVGLVLSSSIGVNQKGLIMMQGLLDGLSILKPADGFADGDAIYLGGTAGTITNVKPSAPDHLVYLGVVTTANNGSSGRMYVRVQNGYELQELHNVAISSPANNNVLMYDSSDSLWKNKATNLFITTGDQTKTATATPTIANITGLSVATSANKRYAFEGYLHVGCNGTGGVKFAVTAPAGSTVSFAFMGPANPNISNGVPQFISASATLTTFALANAVTSIGIVKVFGEVTTGATTGTINFGFDSSVNSQTSTIYQNATNIIFTER